MVSRNLTILFLLSISGLACIMLLYFLQENTLSFVGAAIGIGVGFVTCAYIQIFNIRLMGTVSIGQKQQRMDRWLLLTVIGSVILFRVVTNSVNQETQNLISSIVFGWIAIFFPYAAWWRFRNT